MNYFNLFRRGPELTPDPYADPVAYLAALGIEAELVEIIDQLPDAA